MQFYEAVTQARWFKWSSIHAAAVAALLETNGGAEESRSLIADSAARLESAAEVALFYCDLMAAFSSRGLKRRATDFYARLREMPTPLAGGGKTYMAMIIVAMFPVRRERGTETGYGSRGLENTGNGRGIHLLYEPISSRDAIPIVWGR